MKNLQELISDSLKLISERSAKLARKKELDYMFIALNKELKELENETCFAQNNNVYEVGERALIENCSNCKGFAQYKNPAYIDLDICNKCRYNYDSYFEER